MMVLPSASISRDDVLPLDAIPEVPPWIPDRLFGLRVVLFIRCAHCQRKTSGRVCGPRRLPGAEGVRAMVVSKFCRHPALSGVIGDFNADHATVPTESNPSKRDVHARRNLGGTIGRDEERSDWEPLDGHRFYLASLHILRGGVSTRRIRHAVSGLHPEILVRRVENANPGEAFSPVGGKISGNNKSYRKSIEHRKGLAVHLVSDKAFLEDRICKIERLEKKIRAESFRPLSILKALKLHLQRAVLYTG